jgi:hypothetical protein
MKFTLDLINIFIHLGILAVVMGLVAVVVHILLKLNPNFMPKPVKLGPPVPTDIHITEDDQKQKPKQFWDDVNQLQQALDLDVLEFSDERAEHLNEMPPLDRQRELADRILELKR